MLKTIKGLPLQIWWAVLPPAVAKLLVHALSCGSFGYFRDELYFLDCARHLQWGYVDDAPGFVMLYKVALLLGGSLQVVRLLAALAGAGTVVLTALFARELGGKGFAQFFGGLCVLAAPVCLGVDSILCCGTVEPLFWLGCALLAVRIVRTGDAKLWLWFGVVAGLGLQVKYTMGLVLVCFVVGMVLTGARRELRRPLFWGGAGVAFLLFLPSLVWQIRNHFPLLTDMQNISRTGKNVVLRPLQFVGQQIEFLNPLLLPFWLTGLVLLLKRSWTRFLGVFYLLLLVALILLHGKNYYLAAAYPMLFGAGAVAVEAGLERWGKAWPGVALGCFVGATFLLIAPLVLPLLPPERLVVYQTTLRVRPRKQEVSHDAVLDQRLGDQFGWRALADDVAAIYRALPETEQAKTGIYAGNYGEAGAINQFGPALGLPAAICAHQADAYWGLPAVEPGTLICLGCDREGLERNFDSVVMAGEHFHPWGMPEENRPIYLCRGLRTPLKVLWPRITHWN
jgi:hypothetical protein